MPEYRKLREKHTLLELCKTPELAARGHAPADAPRRRRGHPLRGHPPAARAHGRAVRVRQGRGAGRARAHRDRARRSSGCASSIPRTALGLRARGDSAHASASWQGAAHRVRRGALHARELSHRGRQERATSPRRRSSCSALPRLGTRSWGSSPRSCAAYLLAQVAAGADAVQLFDSWVGRLWRPTDYASYVQPHVKHILSDVEKAGVPVIHFGIGHGRAPRGDARGGRRRSSASTGARRSPRRWKRVGYDRAVQGNMDPCALLAPREVAVEAREARARRRCGAARGTSSTWGTASCRRRRSTT